MSVSFANKGRSVFGEIAGTYTECKEVLQTESLLLFVAVLSEKALCNSCKVKSLLVPSEHSEYITQWFDA